MSPVRGRNYSFHPQLPPSRDLLAPLIGEPRGSEKHRRLGAVAFRAGLRDIEETAK